MKSVLLMTLLAYSSISWASEKNHRAELVSVPSGGDGKEDTVVKSEPSGVVIEANFLNERRFGAHMHTLSFPELFGFGGDFQYSSDWTFSIEYSSPRFVFKDAEVGMTSLGVRARFHMFSKSFFVGSGFGKHNFKAQATSNIPVAGMNIATEFTAVASANYVNPILGWYSRYKSGFFWLIEFGLRIPFSVSSSVDVNPIGASAAELALIQSQAEYIALKSSVESSLNLFGKSPFPTSSLFTFGWLF